MANTYTQIYLHVVFSVKNRESLISQEIETELYPYICGACINRKHHVHAIGGTHDHIHMLIGMHPSEGISELIKALKIQSTLWIKEKFGVANFAWQSGFAAFSYSKSLLPQVINYINHQKEHHKVVTFDNEMETIMQRSEMDYKKDYLLKGID